MAEIKTPFGDAACKPTGTGRGGGGSDAASTPSSEQKPFFHTTKWNGKLGVMEKLAPPGGCDADE